MAEAAELSAFSQRRARHITAIQVRNLTAFPVRDAFASALSQPAEQPQFNSQGHFSDDLDVTLSRKRSRRISANSIATFKSFKSDDSAGDDDTHSLSESRGRRIRGSRLSFHGSGSPAARFGGSQAPTIRGHRPRTTSMTSSLNSSIQSSAVLPGLPDHSQTGLEKVIKARLFRDIYMPSRSNPRWIQVPRVLPPPSATPASPVPSGPSAPPPRSPKLPNGAAPRKGVKPSPLSPTEKTAASARRDTPASPSSPSRHTPEVGINIPGTASPSSRKFPPQTPPASPQITLFGSVETAFLLPSPTSPGLPDYLSPIHRPSTNPLFTIDAQAGSWIDPSGQKLKVELWGKIREDLKNDPLSGKGKEKEKPRDHDFTGEDEWRVPLSDDAQAELPSNTLVVTLHPPGRTFYFPLRRCIPLTGGRPPRLRTQDTRRIQSRAGGPRRRPLDRRCSFRPRARRRRRHRRGAGAGADEADRGRSKTAGWQELFKLVMLQSSIQDNQVSLSDVVREIDKVLEGDVTSALKREVSERESLVQGLRKNVAAVYDQSEILKEKIELRRQQLQERREMLALAQELRDEDLTELVSLQSRFTPTRTTLISSLSMIFPIELLSPPDLLYTILDVPLPIPLTSVGPAPPLSLPTHKDVTEDAVATALGYLLAAYLGKGLVYPITCIGSRSMIRDGISAMVGPRMFPLFSKGVDTYRFEYGVFLLNKDIELLMADRDLRALDMRHTLPNLKNLLLTLTDGEGAQLRGPRAFNSPELALTGLESPRAESPVENGNGNATPKEYNAELPVEGNTPPASGSTTPTTEGCEEGYPSAIRVPAPAAAKAPSIEEAAVSVNEEDVQNADDDDDRRTIRGGDGTNEEAAAANGAEQGSEKVLDGVPAPAKPPPPVTPIK
ncbi:hypothetical protein B0H14DRAFT_2876540 [Mycena olivaceomarginata]|nr:hypothetical protein B0H14DRAFT_2876540 [Mycena olivaceomarginata]